MREEDGATHDDEQLPNGTRVIVHDQGYGVATIQGFEHQLVGANRHEMIFDNCFQCKTAAREGGCHLCRKTLQLRGTKWAVVREDGERHHDEAMAHGTRIAVHDHGYGHATIDGFRANLLGPNNFSMVFDNCCWCSNHREDGTGGCAACRKSLQLQGTPWRMTMIDGSTHDDTQLPDGTRVVIEDHGYGVGTIDGFRANAIRANNHSLVTW